MSLARRARTSGKSSRQVEEDEFHDEPEDVIEEQDVDFEAGAEESSSDLSSPTQALPVWILVLGGLMVAADPAILYPTRRDGGS